VHTHNRARQLPPGKKRVLDGRGNKQKNKKQNKKNAKLDTRENTESTMRKNKERMVVYKNVPV
jgi:hypothetical protein